MTIAPWLYNGLVGYMAAPNAADQLTDLRYTALAGHRWLDAVHVRGNAANETTARLALRLLHRFADFDKLERGGALEPLRQLAIRLKGLAK